MKKLVLPGEPGRLWIAKRTIIHAIPGLGDQPRIEPHLGGGTVLAGDWKHRESSDIDVFLPGRTTLADLLEDNEDNLLRKLGGRPIRATATQITIQFERSTLDVSTVAPTPTEGQEPREVDGQEETTLSETQILHGKLKRADEMLVRDAFDICTAAGEAAGALASAVNLLEADELGTIQWLYDAGADTLAGDYDEAISGVPTGRELDPKTLGQRTASAVADHRYRRLVVRVEANAVVVERETGRGSLPTERYETEDERSALNANGVIGHLDRNGPISGAALIKAIRTALYRNETRTVYETGNAETIAYVRECRKAITAPQRPENAGRTTTRQGRIHGYEH